MQVKELTFSRKELTIFLLIMPFLKPEYFSYVSGLSQLYNLAKYAFLAYLLLHFIGAMAREEIRFHGYSGLILVLNAYPVVRMLLGAGWNGEPIKQFLDVLGLVLICENYQNDWKSLIRAAMTYCEAIIYLNFLTIILFPDGLYHIGLYKDNWLLGYSNSEVKYLILAGFVAILYGYTTGTRTRSIVLGCVVAVTMAMLGSVTGIVGITAMVGLYVLQGRKKVSLFNLRNITIVVFLCFIYFIAEENIVHYVSLIRDLTGKTVTFTSRFQIWSKTFELWAAKPLLGYGWKSATMRGLEYNNIYATHAHNTFLEYLYLGGISEIGLFAAAIYILYRMGSKYQGTVPVKAVYACIGGFLVMMLTEAYVTPTVQFIYLLAYFAILHVEEKEPKTDG